MSLTERLFKYRLWVFIGFCVLLITVLFILNFSKKVLSISPAPRSQEIDPKTTVTIVFNSAVDPQSLKVHFNPDVKYTSTYENNNKKVILHPDSPFSVNTTYTINIDSPVSYSSSFTTQFIQAQAGLSNEYQQSVKNSSKAEQPLVEKDMRVAQFRDSLPLDKPTFRVEYIIDSNTFLVHLKGPDANKSKQDFLAFLKIAGVDPSQIKIAYLDNNTNFAISENNLQANRPFGIQEPISISFTKPINRNDFRLDLTPDAAYTVNVNLSGTGVTLKPVDTWSYNTKYTLSVSGTDIDGEQLPKQVFTIQTENHTGI